VEVLNPEGINPGESVQFCVQSSSEVAGITSTTILEATIQQEETLLEFRPLVNDLTETSFVTIDCRTRPGVC